MRSRRFGQLVVVAALVSGIGCDLSTEDRPAIVELEPAPPSPSSPSSSPTTNPPPSPPSSPRPQPTASTASTTTTTVPEAPPVVLRGDGLSPTLRFGTAPDAVIAELTLRWGPPYSDSGWVAAAGSRFGTCPGSELRIVGWDPFFVLFSDGPTPHGPGGSRHFFTWLYQVPDPHAPGPDPGGNRPTLSTEAAISVGDSVAALRVAYGERVELFDEQSETDDSGSSTDDEEGEAAQPTGPRFGVQLPTGGLFGALSQLNDGGIILSIIGGGGCEA